ncbi:MAG: hypothetical protein JWQ35_2371 [Bacteriovoracaceae bacterium]|nr:hypothetical protein [Bacteriovoracaceae bacterium]
MSTLILFYTGTVFAAQTSGNKISGPVIEVTDRGFVIQEGPEKIVIDTDPNTTGVRNPKVGDMVVIEYQLLAKDIENKGKSLKNKK